MKNIIRNIVKNKVLYVIIVIELLILAVMLRRTVRTPVSIDVFPENLAGIEEVDGVLFSSNGIEFDGTSSGSIILAEFPIHSGAVYETEVEYEAGDYAEGISSVCGVRLFHKENEYYNIKQTESALYENLKYVYNRAYVDGSGEGGIVFLFREGSPLVISHIRVIERPIYQWFKLLVFLGMSVIVNLCVYFRNTIIHRIKKEQLAILAIIAVASIPCFVDFVFSGHDMTYHMQRIVLIAKELADGQFPVRLYSYAYGGYGYGAPLFYGDIFLYASAILYNLMVSLQACIQIYIILTTIITTITSYALMRGISQNTDIALFGTLMYVLSPYRISCIWIRAAFGEYTALAFLPLIALGMYKIYSEDTFKFKNSVILGAGVALTALCHLLSVELAMVPLVLVAMLLWKKTFCKKTLLSIICAIFICIGLSAWFIGPMVNTMLALDIRAFNSSVEGNIQETGVYLLQLINPFFAHAGANANSSMRDDPPLSLGIAAIAGAILPIYLFNKNKFNNNFNIEPTLKLFWVIGVLVAAMSTIYFPWSYISRYGGNIIAKLVNECQLSWRYLGMATLIFNVCLVIVLSIARNTDILSAKRIMLYISAIFIVSTGIFFQEYSNSQEEIRKYAWPDPRAGYLYTYFSIDSATSGGVGDAVADVYLKERRFDVDNSMGEERFVSVPIYAFLNVKAKDLNTNKYMKTEMNADGLLVIDIPQGYSGSVQIDYEEPLLWRVCEIISVITLTGVLYEFRKKRDCGSYTN